MKVNLSDPQGDAYQSNHYATCFSGGIGSGKTFEGALWTITQKVNYPNAVGLITANTYSQLQKATLPPLFKQLDELKVNYRYVKNSHTLYIGKSKLYTISMDNYDPHRGIEVGYWWGDEAGYYDEEGFQVISGRIRDKEGPLQIHLTTTPKGYNWLYHYFHPSGDYFDAEKYRLIVAPTATNKHLPDQYLSTLESQYSTKLADQELRGEFVNLTSGRVYWGFDRNRNVVPFEGNSHAAGMDFNVNPMTAVVGGIDGDKLYIRHEAWLENSNSTEMGKHIFDEFGRLTVIPDSTGKRKQTSSAGFSDHDIIQSYGHIIPRNVANPFRIDRYNCVNNLLETGRLLIHPDCKKLIKDLEQCVYKEGSNLLDTTNKDHGHISDALGYLAWWAFPLRKAKPIRVSTY